mgnify:CR=1 FL=1
MYVAVKGGEKAIDNAHLWLGEERRGDVSVSELSLNTMGLNCIKTVSTAVPINIMKNKRI